MTDVSTYSDVWRAQLATNAHQRAERPAITWKTAAGFLSLSHAALFEKVRAYDRLFRAHTAPGQVIPLCLARTGEAIAAMYGALLSGRAFCNVNPKLRAPQLEFILSQLRSPIALVDGQGVLALRAPLSPSSPLAQTAWHVVQGSALSRLGERALQELAVHSSVVRHDQESRSDADAIRHEPAAHTEDSVGCCLFTSGSTGTPKGVLISRGDLRARATVELSWLGLAQQDVVLNVLPFSFDVGLNQVLATTQAGAELVVLESWLPADILATVAARGVTGIAAVPMIWADFMAHGSRFDHEGAHRALRYITVSGGDLTPAQHRSLPALAPSVQIFKTYGQTEAFRISSLRPEEYAERPCSIGRALPGGNLYVLREDGTAASPGELGEVVHTGVGTMLGYLDDPREGEKLRSNPCFGERDRNTLAVFTGDLGVLDEHGYLTLRGRRDEMVKVSGNRVYPAELKALLCELAEVASAEVVPVAGERGTQLVAFVVAREAAQLDGEALRRILATRAPSYMVPTSIEICSELPRTASGKPDRPLLQARAAERLAGEG
jgi:acyl-coenzyme A synthetase/AMP-(fatty) acid ligase